jgi:hypothetical protein
VRRGAPAACGSGRVIAGLLPSILLSAGGSVLALLAAEAGRTPRQGVAGALGRVIVVTRPTMVRTRGGGNVGVDLPRGRGVVLKEVDSETALLEPAPADADLLRQFGVRRVPLYTIPRARLEEDFVTEEDWSALRRESETRIRERWPSLGPLEVERILLGEPFAGMTLEQAEEAVGAIAFSRETRDAAGTAEQVWTIGRRTRAAELRAFTERRERGLRAATFDDYLRLRTRAVLVFRSGRLEEILPPPAGPLSPEHR